MKTFLAYFIPILLAYAVGAIGAYVQGDALVEWYPALVKSPATPPAILFPIAWSVLYLLMGISAGTMLAKGDVALSVTLTAISSIVTLFTIPFIMNMATEFVFEQSGTEINLPIGKLLIQNVVLFLIPMLLGIALKKFRPATAEKVNKALSKIAFPALIVLALTFFLQYTKEIFENFALIGLATTTLILAAMLCSSLLSRVGNFNKAVRRTIVMEVGMQNAAQAIAIASSPFIFNSGEMAIPAIIYALMMNVILLVYVAIVKRKNG
jgi:BASS family bile acid:Na+ symporter